MTIEDIEAREKAATEVRNTANYWAKPWRMADTVEIRATWFQPVVSDLSRASGLVDSLLAQLKDREEKLEAVEGALAHDKAPHMGLWFKIDRILKGGE